MDPRPDSNSFTKFIISAGALLIVAALIVPAFIIRDTGTLTIPRKDLREFTPLARHELERRQTVARDSGYAAPFLGGALLIGGAFLIVFGIPRLKAQEETADEHAKAEVDKLHNELKPQTAKEREAGAAAEVADEQQPKPVAKARSQQERPPKQASKGSDSIQLRSWVRSEEKVLARLAEIAPPRYDLQSKVKLEDASSSQLLLDALFISQVDQIPDIVVEIKFAGPHIGNNIGNRMTEAESHLLRYLARYRRNSIGWMIFYADAELSVQNKERIERRAADLHDLLKVSTVTPETLRNLALPIGT